MRERKNRRTIRARRWKLECNVVNQRRSHTTRKSLRGRFFNRTIFRQCNYTNTASLIKNNSNMYSMILIVSQGGAKHKKSQTLSNVSWQFKKSKIKNAPRHNNKPGYLLLYYNSYTSSMLWFRGTIGCKLSLELILFGERRHFCKVFEQHVAVSITGQSKLHLHFP